MKKVLILTPFPPDGIGGAESFVKELIKEISKEHDVRLCTLKPRKNAWKGTGFKNIISVMPILFFKALFSMKKIDIIHAQGLISGLIAVLLNRIFKVRVYITLLALYEFDTKNKYFNAASQWVFNNCDRIFVEGENGKSDIRRFKVESKVRVFQHWVDQDLFKPPKHRNNSKIRVLFVGRPIPEKGRHIVEAAERLLEGKGYEFQYVENAPLETLPGIYQMADIVVIPSLYAEGFSRVVAESASCGCALIVSNRGSLPEMCRDFAKVIEPTGEKVALAIRTMDLKIYQDMSSLYAFKNFSSKNAEVFVNEYHN